jgi:hypothetical protein
MTSPDSFPELPSASRPAVAPAVALQEAITLCTHRGWRLQSVGINTAVMVSGGGSGPNHVLHAILSLFTCGAWLIIWLIVALVDQPSPEKSLLVLVDEAGTVSYQPGN